MPIKLSSVPSSIPSSTKSVLNKKKVNFKRRNTMFKFEPRNLKKILSFRTSDNKSDSDEKDSSLMTDSEI